ncbi:MAG: holin family protein [Proteobacteria bacterium]|nr:holin family protein [Pseudomonadota bacterium]
MKPLLAPILGKVLDKIPDPNAREKARAELSKELMQALAQADSQQVEINKLEAQNPNLFVAGWRPFIGWTCGVAIAWVFLLQPIVAWGCAIFYPTLTLPQIQTENLLELVFAMLGMSGLRSYEKIRGVNSK